MEDQPQTSLESQESIGELFSQNELLKRQISEKFDSLIALFDEYYPAIQFVQSLEFTPHELSVWLVHFEQKGE